MFGKPTLRDRDEEEVRGYRDALKLIPESGAKLPIAEATIKKLHKLCRGDIWDAGAYKEKDGRVGQLKSPRGEKTEAVLAAVERQIRAFRVADVQAGCPGVGLDLIRRVLARLQREKMIKSLGTGRGAKWEKTGN